MPDYTLRVNGASRTMRTDPFFTFNYVPAVEVHPLNQLNERPLGVDEASQGPIGAAIANAIAHATGRRLRDLPFTPDKIKAALA